MAEAAEVIDSNPAADAPFVKELIKIWRAQDTHGHWDGKADLDAGVQRAPYGQRGIRQRAGGIRTFIKVHRPQLNRAFKIRWKRPPAHRIARRFGWIGDCCELREEMFE